MREDKAKREKRLNMIGAGCGLFLALLLFIIFPQMITVPIGILFG